MRNKLKWLAPVLALGMLGLAVSLPVQADDNAPATQPAPVANGSIVVKVVDSTGGPAASVNVRLYAAATAASSSGGKRKAIAKGTTDDQGSFTFSDVAPGDYTVQAGNKTAGKGHAKVTVDGSTAAAVTITLQPKSGNTPPATTPPATQPAGGGA